MVTSHTNHVLAAARTQPSSGHEARVGVVYVTAASWEQNEIMGVNVQRHRRLSMIVVVKRKAWRRATWRVCQIFLVSTVVYSKFLFTLLLPIGTQIPSGIVAETTPRPIRRLINPVSHPPSFFLSAPVWFRCSGGRNRINS